MGLLWPNGATAATLNPTDNPGIENGGGDNWISFTDYGSEVNVLQGDWIGVVVHYTGTGGDSTDTRIGFTYAGYDGISPWRSFKFYEDACGGTGGESGWYYRSYTFNYQLAAELTGDRGPVYEEIDVLNNTSSTANQSISASVTDDNPSGGSAGVSAVTLSYKFDDLTSTIYTVDMTMTSGDAEDGTWAGDIPGQSLGTKIYWWLNAEDINENTTASTIYSYYIMSDGLVVVPGDLPTIQQAIDFSNDGDTVLVNAGTYMENINFSVKNIAVIGEDWETTIIDGNQSGSVVTFINEEDSTALLRNFTVTNGTGSLFDNSIMGGGILIGSSTHPKIENILITGNSAADGGGIYIFHNSTPILSNLTITNNVAVSGGGGINFQVCSPILINSTISNNTAGDGGGIRGHSSNVIIDNVSIIGNSSAANGGGLIFDDGSNPTLTDVNISSNTASGNGGGMYLNQSNPTQTNVTISGNTCENNGGGFFMKNNSNPSFSNSILWNDLPQEIYMEGSGGGEPNNATIDHTDIQGGQDSIVTNDNGTIIWGSGNIDVDPHFVDPENGDYHLADWSPCIATGLDTSIVSSTDIEGNPRPNPAGSNPDLGAYENALGAPVEHIVIVSDTLLVSEDSSATVDFRENDLVLNAIALFLSIIDSSSHGSIILTGDTMLTYTPAADFFGYDTVQYALSGTTAADTGFVFITVVNEDDMPVVVNAIPDITVNEDAPDSLLADLDVVFMDIDDELEYSHVIVDTTLVFASVTNDSVTLQFLPDANGSTDIIFTATNPTIRASVSDTMTVTILPINDAPLMSVITDTTVDEETELEILLTASDVDGDVLTFSATADTSAVIVAVSTDTLSVSLVDNWNGSSILMVVVSDGSATDTTSFELTVNAVNDAPSSFALNEQDSVYIAMANFDSDSIVFTWDESADVDEDELTYHFTAELIINGQLTTEYDTTLTANEMKIDYQSVFDEIYAAQAMLAAIEWDVSVSDGVEEVMAENGPLTVGINASDAVLSIDEELLPEVYALHQNYPNPFNPITTLRYDLPEQANVNIIIYDMLGRQVRTLLNEIQDAGYRSVIWNATNDYGKPVSAGVYLYKIQAGEFVQTRKMVLLK